MALENREKNVYIHIQNSDENHPRFTGMNLF
jgi:hypothetical protein